MIIDVHTHLHTQEVFDRMPQKVIESMEKAFKTKFVPLRVEAMVEDMEKYKIEKMLLLPTVGSYITNEMTASAVKKFPENFIGIGDVDPRIGRKAVEEAERCAKDLNFKGIKFILSPLGIYANDKLLYPIYEKMTEHRMVIIFHGGQEHHQPSKLKYSDPIFMDDVAVDFPDLKILIAHTAWPWEEVAIAAAQRNKNVYIDISGWMPRYLPKAAVTQMNTVLANKFLFGSDYPVYSMERVLREFNELPLKDEVKQKILCDNAKHFLNI